MEELLKLLKEIDEDIDYTTEKNLVDSGLFASFDIIQCVVGCEDLFNIEIPEDEIKAENFQSADTIWKMVRSLTSKK